MSNDPRTTTYAPDRSQRRPIPACVRLNPRGALGHYWGGAGRGHVRVDGGGFFLIQRGRLDRDGAWEWPGGGYATVMTRVTDG